MKFEKGKKLTIISVNGMAMTSKNQIEITGESQGRMTYKEKGKRKEYYLKIDNKVIVFEGWEIPYLVDSDTNYFRGNACFNFITDEPEKLKAFVESKNINTEFNEKGAILWIDNKNEENILYPEIIIHHAVIERIRNKTLNHAV